MRRRHRTTRWLTPAGAAAVLAAAGLLAAGAAAAQEAWVSEVEIRGEPVRDDGQQDWTVRILPARTQAYDQITVECVYRQEFPWENAWGKKYTKIHEPVRFTYRRPDVRLVHDLDCYLSFRMPVSMDRLLATHGKTSFNRDYPVSVDRMVISAASGGQTVWSYELKTAAKHVIPPPRAGAAGAVKQDDLDLDK